MPTFDALNSNMLKAAVVDGALAEAAIAVTGLAVGDVLLAVIHQGDTGVLAGNLLAEADIAEAGQLELSTTDTTDGKLLVLWLDVSQAEA
ncbi:MAG: hypothetical protein HYU66_15285 [Armatimonadetes bacterium]|nr:hypothetical protein [Armatimonadota bacterium]